MHFGLVVLNTTRLSRVNYISIEEGNKRKRSLSSLTRLLVVVS